MNILKFALRTILFFLLTVLTQIGGLIYLLSLFTHKFIDKKFKNAFLKATIKFSSFLALYLVFTLLIVPMIAKPFGRVALPLTESNNLRPLNLLTCLLNRHYVRPALREATIEVASQMNKKHPGTIINYLDANFPFMNGFPLVPHLSHNDGKKLDLAFLYREKSGNESNDAPSFIGYGISEEPRDSEKNTAQFCSENGYWQYSFMKSIIPQGRKDNFKFDSERTKDLVNLYASNPSIEKIFIEPHLKTRLGLTSDKIRFHGCQAVRHDDHVHVQLK
jgi:hypothetical protein